MCFLKIYMWDEWGKYGLKNGQSTYNMEQEGNHGWLWNAHLNRSPGGTLLSIFNDFVQYKEHRSI